ncbi:unnamed protein product [Cuscuta epithymum]|uniref:GATA-type domain-containing protein n=1 Tax=Cuscuta epithymum TaxID=186058 RepID=A0AAV0CRQ8_9ASTE|nr:unnamed protein product [Cuscuta epithymum]
MISCLQTRREEGFPHPPWLLRGFREAVWASGLSNFHFEGYQFTWERWRGTPNWVEEKLDRILTSESWLDSFGNAAAETLEGSPSDHMALVIKLQPVRGVRRRRRFKFENVWLKEADCREVVVRGWFMRRERGVVGQIEDCRREVGSWGKDRCGDYSKRIGFCRKRLNYLRLKSDVWSTLEFNKVKAEYINLLEKENQFWRQRAKEFWYRGGDLNTRFFHNVVKSRRRRNRVEGFKLDGGRWERDREELGRMVEDYFINIFTSVQGDRENVLRCVSSKLEAHHNLELLRPIQSEEVKVAVFSMHPDKSPGPDGMSPGFFQHFWDVLGPDIVDFCKTSFNTGHLPEKSAFVPGRSIVDNVMLAFESHHYLRRKRQGKTGYAALKLDMSKAYDRVEWDFLEGIMRRLGFGDRWVSLIMNCISSVSYSIPFDDGELGPIWPSRGLRQGDPLSPYLFILVAEGLSTLISREEARGRIHGVSIARRAPRISHLFFADDSLLFFQATHREVTAVREILHAYETASGQTINYNKSKFFFSANVPAHIQEGLMEVMRVEYAGNEEKYLGLPAFFGKRKKEILSYIRNRVVSRIQNWNSKFLSRAGREIMLKTVIQAMPTYTMNVFLLPLDLCRELEVMMNGYWWKGKSEKGIRWRNWDSLCKPKKYGGMGFRKIRDFNLAMLAKQAWKLQTEPESLVSRVFKARYFPDGSYVTAKIGGSPSFIWRSLFEVQNIIKKGSKWRVGNGNHINVWRDSWLPDKVNPKITSVCVEGLEEATVAGLLNSKGEDWDLDILKDLFNERDIDLIRSIPISNRLVEDRLIWSGEQNGCFSVKSCYRQVVGEFRPEEWLGWTAMWKFQLPPKIKHFFWQVCTNCLPTTSNLIRRGVECRALCGLCGDEGDESLLHLFVTCREAKEAWRAVNWRQVNQSVSAFPDWLQLNFQSLQEKELTRLILGCWGIWRERNQRVWNGSKLDRAQILRKAEAYVEGWSMAQLPKLASGSRWGVCSSLWQRPGMNWGKVNTDASVRNGGCGFG